MSNEIAEKYMEEKPQIGEIPVAPDERENTPLIQGTGVEDTTITEGTVTFDIRFTAAVPSVREKIGLILNVEAQNQFHPGYPLIKEESTIAAGWYPASMGRYSPKAITRRSKKCIPSGSVQIRRNIGKIPLPDMP